MADTPLIYRPLTITQGSPRSFSLVTAGYRRCFLGPDHLLFVERDFLKEHYRRIYFKDIQAIVWTTTNDWKWEALGFLLIALIFFLLAYLSWSDIGIYLSGVGMVMLLGLVTHLLKGPSCRCLLKTAAQFIPLHGISRVKNVEVFLREMRPKIHEHQAVRTGAISATGPAATPQTNQT